MTTETNAPAEPEAKVETTQDDGLNSLLSEWDDTPEEPVKAAPQETPSNDPMVQELYRDMVESDVRKAVDKVHGDLEDFPARPSKSMIRDWMEGRATKDSRLNKAFIGRRQNPDGWDNVVGGLGDEFKKQFEMKSASNGDRESAAAFVRGSSTKVVPEPEVSSEDMSRMSDREFNDFQRKKYGV